MAFTGNYMATSFKKELLQALHNFTSGTGDAFKIALYTNNASFTAATTGYTVTNEAVGVNYVAGGNTLVNVTPTSLGTTGLTDFEDSIWASSTITARGAMIYNSTAGINSVVILDFGSDKSSTAGVFSIKFPVADAANAIIRIA